MDNFEFTVPVLVVGGGACGAVAALTAHAYGAEVLLAEQDATPAGTTSMSQGLMCAAGTKAQKSLGIEDDADTFYADILAKTKGQTDPIIARAIADTAGPCLDWLTDVIGYPFSVDTGFRAAYGHSRQRMHGWDGHGGADMIQLLHQKLAERDIPVLLQARLADIIADESGRVQGVVLERPDGSQERVGCETLILASGGFAANHEMVAKNMPEAANARHNGHEGNRGDGILLGAKLGAALGDMGSYQGYAMLADPSGITVPPGVIVEGGVLVNKHGDRFVDETADIAGMVLPVMAQPDGQAWVLYDAVIEEKTAYTLEVQAMREYGAIRKADNIEALAEIIGAPPTSELASALAATLDAARAAAESGQPDAFGRVWGNDRPPQWPLHVTKVGGAIYHTQGGLQIDGQARVLRPDGTALPNLFAGGGAARGVSGPSYWGYLPAMGLGSAITLGHIAGKTAAALVKS
ncbi:FAD-dependent oxidoreductase [Polymorphobacter sp.]|uniref:FAD-dependent oxidoreductase n=1 Tax=Polymorphobacter sp. TaxID=1909290 RepID=UPI003F72F5BC